MTETTEPKCTCGAQTGKPHAEDCPITAWAREAFRLSGEFARGDNAEYMKDADRRELAASIPDDMRDALREFTSPTGRTRADGINEAFERLRDYGRDRRVVIVGAGMADATARMLREALSKDGYDVLIDAPREVVHRSLADFDFAMAEQRVIAATQPHRLVQIKSRTRERGNGFTYRVLYGAGKFADVDNAVRRVRLAQNKRKAQRRARTGRK